MIKTYNLIKSVGCKTINAWSIKINNKSYIITPAHNLIYQPTTNTITNTTTNTLTNVKYWSKSNFIDSSDIKYFQKEYDNKWYVTKQYIETKSLLYDLAWIETDNNYMKSINLNTQLLKKITNGSFYFYQPYDYKGDKTNEFSLGQVNGILYKSPIYDYYECLGVGFRGMSGSIVTNKNKCIGIFIRTGTNLGTNKLDSTIEMNLLKLNAMRRGIIMPSHKIIELIKMPQNELITFDKII